MAVRASARTSLLLFTASFVASSVYRLWPGAVGRWLVRNRRYLGVAFAASHAIHLAGIVTLVAAFDAEVAPLTLVVGGLGYVLLAAMTATSFDATARRLGATQWKRLHGFGARYLWFVFFATTSPTGVPTPIRASLFAVVVGAAVVRTAALLAARRRVATGAAS